MLARPVGYDLQSGHDIILAKGILPYQSLKFLLKQLSLPYYQFLVFHRNKVNTIFSFT